MSIVVTLWWDQVPCTKSCDGGVEACLCRDKPRSEVTPRIFGKNLAFCPNRLDPPRISGLELPRNLQEYLRHPV